MLTNQKGLVNILFLLLLLAGIALGVYLVQQKTNLLPRAFNQNDYDVIVVGAGTGGVSAALQAAKMGSRVALVEETDWVGGQMTAAGVSTMDEGSREIRQSGIYKDFIDKVKSHYQALGKSVGTCYGDDQTVCFEPQVGQQILKQMLSEQPGITLLLRQQVVSVVKTGNKVEGVGLSGGRVLKGKVVIDATEYGDIIPMTGARYRLGNSTSDNVNQNSCIQDLTYTAVIKKYPNGVPEELVMKNPPPGYSALLRNRFALIVPGFGDFARHNVYRGLPDSSNPQNYSASQTEAISKTVINWANDYPAEYPYETGKPTDFTNSTLKINYLEDKNYRKQANCEAKLKTLQFIYYVQRDLGKSDWSVANDEGFDTAYNMEENSCANIPAEFKAMEKHFPLIPYVRESRRLIGMQTLTGKDIKRVGNPTHAQRDFESSVVVGDYGTDLHNCRSEAALEADLEGLGEWMDPVKGAFQIPFESFIPQDIDGFLVAEKNLSQSRLASGATRLQPSTMQTGQAVGAIAALAAQKQVEPRSIKPIEVQKVLVENKAPVSLFSMNNSFADVGVDNWAWSSVQIASTYNIMTGYGDGRFGVDDPLLRRHAALVFARTLKWQTQEPQNIFVDVPSSDSDVKEREALYRAGITRGCTSDGPRFCPEDPLTRAQTAVMLARALQLDLSRAPTEPVFVDVKADYWAFREIQALYQKGITVGCSESPKQFCPDRQTTRGEMATFIARLLFLN